MAITQYSPIPNQQVIQQYQPQDFRYLIAAGENKQRAYDESEATVARGQEMLQNVKVIDGDVADKNSRVQKYMTDAQDLVRDKYNNDWGAALPEIKRMANGVTKDPWFDHAARHYEVLQEADKRKNNFKTNPLTWKNSIYTGKTSDGHGGYNTLGYDAEEQLDWDKKRKEVVGAIEGDSGISNLMQSGAAGILQAVKTKGVNAGKLKGIVDANVNNYMGSAEGQQEIRSLLQRNPKASSREITEYMRSSIFGSNSGKIFNQLDKYWHTDPLAKEKYDALKDENQIIIGQGSQASDYKPFNDLDRSLLERKSEAQVSFDNVNWGNAATNSIGGSNSATAKGTLPDIRAYEKLNPATQEKFANLLQGSMPELAKKFRNGTITDAERDKAKPALEKRMKALENIKFAPQITSIPESMNYGSYGKGEVGATKMVQAKMSSMVWINKANNEKLSGKEFIDKYYNPARAAASKSGAGADGVMRVMGQVSPFNHYGLQYNDNRFGDAMQVAIDGNEWVGGGLDQKKQHMLHDKYGRKAAYLEDISGPRNQINEIATKTVSQLGSPVQVLPGKNAPKYTVQMNDDGKYTLPEELDAEGNPLIVDNPAEYIQQAREHYQDLQSQQASKAVTKRR